MEQSSQTQTVVVVVVVAVVGVGVAGVVVVVDTNIPFFCGIALSWSICAARFRACLMVATCFAAESMGPQGTLNNILIGGAECRKDSSEVTPPA